MFSHCTFRSVQRIYCPASLTIEIQANVQWKRPASVARACPESSLRFSFAASPLILAGLRETHWLHWEEGWWGVLLVQPWPKLGFHNLTKNNREQDGKRGKRDQVCAHIHIGCVQSEGRLHAPCI